jgi:hypothetical protein
MPIFLLPCSHNLFRCSCFYHPFTLQQFLPSTYFCLEIKYMKFLFLDLHTLGIWNTTQPNGLAVPDASMHSVNSMKDVLELMNIGLMNRATSATALNERSSRSHRLYSHFKDFLLCQFSIYGDTTHFYFMII